MPVFAPLYILSENRTNTPPVSLPQYATPSHLPLGISGVGGLTFCLCVLTAPGELTLVAMRPPGWCRESRKCLAWDRILSWDWLRVLGRVTEPLSLSFLISELEVIT